MKRFQFKSLATIAGLGAAFALGMVVAAPAHSADDPNSALATVNGHTLTAHDVDVALSNLNDGMRANVLKDKKTRHEIVQQLIDQEVLVQEADKEKMSDDPTFKDAMNAFRRQYLSNRILAKQLDGKITDAALKKYYDAHRTQYSTDRVHAMHILVKDEALAKDLIAKAKAGADFQDLAEKYSIDPSAKNNRGDLGFFGRGVMVPEFTEAAFDAKEGEVVAKPVRTAFGYHVIKVIEKRSGKALTFLDVQETIRNQLRQELSQNYVAQLRDTAKVTVDESAIDKM